MLYLLLQADRKMFVRHYMAADGLLIIHSINKQNSSWTAVYSNAIEPLGTAHVAKIRVF